jgi:FkbM family methyltransferase
MNLFNIFKPEYYFRPSQVWRRMMHRGHASVEMVTLPWGLPLRVRTDDIIGRQILALGVFELVESEVLWRLTERGDYCVDVGANIGYTASLLACRAGKQGIVQAYEPHPLVFHDAFANVNLWKKFDIAFIELRQFGISDIVGKMKLIEPKAFMGNRGLASFNQYTSGTGILVDVSTLDSLLMTGKKIGVLKIDVEGHEIAVLNGAYMMLNKKIVRDIIYEDHNPFPSNVSTTLLEAGYSIFRLDYSWWKPNLTNPSSIARNRRQLETPNFLATLEPERALSKLKSSGWNCLTCLPCAME